MEIDRMRALLSALQEARYSGRRSDSSEATPLTYGSEAELANAIADLESRIARAAGTARRRRWGTVATKGL